MRTQKGPRARIAAREAVGAARPTMLATLGVPFDPEAVAFAVDSAVETGQPLVVVNLVELAPLPLSTILGYDQLEEASEVTRAPAELAQSLGVLVERLRMRTLHPVDALVELVAERGPGILVFGPERSKLRPRRYRRTVKAVRERVSCLLWLAS
jgi:universal stress protein family protein